MAGLISPATTPHQSATSANISRLPRTASQKYAALRPFYADGDESRLGSLEAHLMKGARREAFELGRIKLRLIAADMRKIEIRGQLIERFGRDERRPDVPVRTAKAAAARDSIPRPATCRSRARRCASIIPRPTPWSTDYGGPNTGTAPPKLRKAESGRQYW